MTCLPTGPPPRSRVTPILACLALLLAVGTPGPGPAQPLPERSCDPAILLWDASGSMGQPVPGRPKETRIEQARLAAADVLPALTARRAVGLMTYGGQVGGRDICDTIRLRVAPRTGAAADILREVTALEPFGGTPLAESVRTAAETLGDGGAPALIVVVTDGIESCKGDPCAVARDIAERANGVRVHIIGFGLTGTPVDGLRCLTRETNGLYADVHDTSDLAAALRASLTCTLSMLPHSGRRSGYSTLAVAA
jgi:Ca-activated chloride channel homolog